MLSRHPGCSHPGWSRHTSFPPLVSLLSPLWAWLLTFPLCHGDFLPHPSTQGPHFLWPSTPSRSISWISGAHTGDGPAPSSSSLRETCPAILTFESRTHVSYWRGSFCRSCCNILWPQKGNEEPKASFSLWASLPPNWKPLGQSSVDPLPFPSLLEPCPPCCLFQAQASVPPARLDPVPRALQWSLFLTPSSQASVKREHEWPSKTTFSRADSSTRLHSLPYLDLSMCLDTMSPRECYFCEG